MVKCAVCMCDRFVMYDFSFINDDEVIKKKNPLKTQFITHCMLTYLPSCLSLGLFARFFDTYRIVNVISVHIFFFCIITSAKEVMITLVCWPVRFV